MILEPCQSRLNSPTNAIAMRATIAILLIATALAVPSVQAKSEPGWAQVLSDPKDNAIQSVPLPNGFESWDLRAVDIMDTEDHVTFRITVHDLLDGPNLEGRGQIDLHFRHVDVQYTVHIYEVNEIANYAWSNLRRWSDITQTTQYVAFSDAVLDYEANTYTVTYAKIDLTDSQGAAPFPGRVLDSFWAESRLGIGNVGISDLDRMPDAGEGLPYVMTAGLPQVGISAWSKQPMRSSNGAATTYVYTVLVQNPGEPFEAAFSSIGVPSGWSVEFPQSTVPLATGVSEHPVLVSVPFAHQHGSTPTFVVKVGDGQRSGQVRLGIDYPSVPQPSGHHPNVYMHTENYGGVDADVYELTRMYGKAWGWMNTLEGALDEGDDQVPLAGYSTSTGMEAGYGWFLYLSDLRLGLDFQLEEKILASIPIETTAPLGQAWLSGHLYAGWRTTDGNWEQISIARFATDATDLDAGSHVFEVEALPMVEADRIAPHKDMYLAWNLWLNGQRPTVSLPGYASPASAALLPGGSTTLPLVEYHDAIEEVYEALNGIYLRNDGSAFRLGNPGETIVYNVTVRNPGAAVDVNLALRGQHAEWAHIVGNKQRTVSNNGSIPVQIAVAIPSDAVDGTQLDLLVQATDGSYAALLRLAGTVTTTTDVANARPESVQNTPSLGLPTFALVVALAMLILRASERNKCQ